MIGSGGCALRCVCVEEPALMDGESFMGVDTWNSVDGGHYQGGHLRLALVPSIAADCQPLYLT
jgi:hypothetical protein